MTIPDETLIDRLSKLDGPDREIDKQIKAWSMNARKITIRDVGDIYVTGQHSERVFLNPIEPFTASVDAAIALARRLWPDVMYRVGNHAEGFDPSLYLGEIFLCGDKRDSYLTGVASSAATALCIALLRAKEVNR